MNRIFTLSMGKLLVLLSVSLCLSACVSNLSGEAYTKEEARKVQRVKLGTVEHHRLVIIEGDQEIGGAAGTIAGGIAGSTVGDGRGGNIAAIAGAVVGAAIGTRAEEKITRKQGIEYTVRLDNGQLIAIVQQLNENETPLGKGARVQVISGENSRVVAYN